MTVFYLKKKTVRIGYKRSSFTMKKFFFFQKGLPARGMRSALLL